MPIRPVPRDEPPPVTARELLAYLIDDPNRGLVPGLEKRLGIVHQALADHMFELRSRRKAVKRAAEEEEKKQAAMRILDPNPWADMVAHQRYAPEPEPGSMRYLTYERVKEHLRENFRVVFANVPPKEAKAAAASSGTSVAEAAPPTVPSTIETAEAKAVPLPTIPRPAPKEEGSGVPKAQH
jgi:hypothetical protein